MIGTVSGPHVTRYELRLAPGIKMSKVAQLKDDIAYALAAEQVRILAPIPGKTAVGVEVPNRVRKMVHLGDVFQDAPRGWSPLSVWLGKDIAGKAIGTDLAKQPHILIAGTTGSGKSGCVNAMLSSVLLRSSPNEVRMVLVDPKRVELNHYEGIPHLLTPVVTSPRLAANVLGNLIKEMEERYGVMSRAKTRSLVELNRVRVKQGEAPLPYILCVIDELADLMMVAPADVEDSIIRLAQKSRAVGIHLVLATQRPSADIITGMIKANVPARIAFAVSSQTDSRVILDQNGAESLLGQGDMLFRPVRESRVARIQGAFIDRGGDREAHRALAPQGEPELQEELLEAIEPEEERGAADGDFDPDADDLLGDAIATVVQMGTASTSMLQRRLRVGYTRAGRLIDMMERRGVISGYEGSKARQVLSRRPICRACSRISARPPWPPPPRSRGPGRSITLRASWQRLATRCGRRGCASGSTSPTSRRAPRSAQSTCVPSRTRSSGCSRARRSSRLSCAPTRRNLASIRTSCWRSTEPSTSPGTTSSTSGPLGPPNLARDRRRRGPRLGPGSLLLLVVVVVVGALVAIGLLADGDDDGGEVASETTPRTEPTERSQQQPERRTPTRVVLRITPITPTYVCVDRGSGKPVLFENTIDAPQTFRGKVVRVNLGKTDVEIRKNGRPVSVATGPDPVGFEFTVRGRRPLPLGERPCA